MNPHHLNSDALNRRLFFKSSGLSLGATALAGLIGSPPAVSHAQDQPSLGLPGLPSFPPKAKRIIYLFQSGAPSQMDLFDPKPQLESRRGQELPESIRQGQRLTTMTSGQNCRRNVSDPVDAYRSDQSRSRHNLLSDGIAVGRAAQYRFVVKLRTGERESRLAGVCRAHQFRQWPTR